MPTLIKNITTGNVRIFPKPDGTKEYSLFDHLGSVRMKLDAEGNVLGNYDYEPFGKAIGNIEAPRLGFIDKEKDLIN